MESRERKKKARKNGWEKKEDLENEESEAFWEREKWKARKTREKK